MGRIQLLHGLCQARGGQQLGSKAKTEKDAVFPHHALKTSWDATPKCRRSMHFPEPWKGGTTDPDIGVREGWLLAFICSHEPRGLCVPRDPAAEQTQFPREFLIKPTNPSWAQACLSLLEGKDVRFLSNSFIEQPIEMSVCQAIHGKRRGGSISNLRTDTLLDRWHRGWGFITACSKT